MISMFGFPRMMAIAIVIWWFPTSLKAFIDKRSFVRRDATVLNAERKRVVVVGGGVGGLAVASRVAAATDAKVSILEKNAVMGGRCGSFEVHTSKGTFRHERGPSLLLLKDVYEKLFLECTGKSAREFGLEMEPCLPAYQVVFDDGDTIELGFPSDSGLIAREKISRDRMSEYETDGAAKWDEYMAATAAFLDCGLPNFIEERLDLLSFPALIYHALRGFGKAWPLKPHSDVLDATFESNKMRVLASFQNLYVGLQPYRDEQYFGGGVLRKTAPAVFGLLAAIELHPNNQNSGVFAPIGGFEAVTESLVKLAESLGVELEYETMVRKVSNDGVHCEGDKFVPADIVIVNADLPYATQTIMKDNNVEYDWDDRFDFSSGVIAFHWAIGKELPDLNTHNVFLVAESRERAEESWRCLQIPADKKVQSEVEPFNFYVHRASCTDPTAAPPGCDALFVLVPCTPLKRNEEYSRMPRKEAVHAYQQQFSDAVIDQARQAVFLRLAQMESLQDLPNHILNEVVDTPATYVDHYNVAAGTPFALSHGLSQLSLTRPGAESPSHPNVLHVGASSRPGNGVPLVLIGAKQVAERVLRRLK